MAVNLANMFVSEGHKVALLTWDSGDSNEIFFQIDKRIKIYSLGVDGKVLDRKSTFFEKIGRVARLNSILNKNNFRTVFCFQLGIVRSFAAIKCFHSFRLVALERNSIQRYKYNTEKKWLNNLVIFFFVDKVGLQAPSYILDYPWILRSRLQVAPNFLNDELSMTPFPVKNSRSELTVAVVGRYSFQKDSDRVLSFVSQLAKIGGVKIGVYGSGYPKVEKSHMDPKVKFYGPVKAWYNEKIDVCVLLSRWEGIPNVFLESMASGIVCLGETKTKGVRDLLNFDRGFLGRDEKELIKIVQSLTYGRISFENTRINAYYFAQQFNKDNVKGCWLAFHRNE